MAADQRWPEHRRVWMYWEHDPARGRAPYLDLCMQTILKNRGTLALEMVDERTIFDWLPELDITMWNALRSPTSRSDYGRIRLLHTYGGLYLDADCIAMAPLHCLTAPLESNSFVSFGLDDGPIQNNFFAARAGDPVLEQWIDAQDRVLSNVSDPSALPRTALGEPLLTPIASHAPHFTFPERTIAPVMWYEWGRFFSRCTAPRRVLQHRPLTVMLYNEFMGGPLRATSIDDLRNGRTLLSRLFRIALGMSTVEDETDIWTRAHVLADARYSSFGRALRGKLRRIRGHRRPAPASQGSVGAYGRVT
jgi:hypothetical protein